MTQQNFKSHFFVALAVAVCSGAVSGSAVLADPARDEANRQAVMARMRDTAATNDRQNADRAFQDSLRNRSSGVSGASGSQSSSSSSSSSSSQSSSSGSGSTNGNSSRGGPQSVVASRTIRVTIQETPERSAIRLRAEAAAGNGESQYFLGRMHLAGYGVPVDLPLARRLFIDGSRNGSGRWGAESSAYAGWMLQYGKGGPVDFNAALIELNRAVAGGNNYGKSLLGLRLLGEAVIGGGSVSMRTAERLLVAAADSGESVAQEALGGTIYLYGVNDVAIDTPKAMRYLKLAAAQDSTMALTLLGIGQISGWAGFENNQAEGWNYVRKSIALGDGAAMGFAGKAYLVGGEGVTRNVQEGVRLLKTAIDANNREAMSNYGLALLQGQDVPKDESAGVALLRRASALNEPSAQAI